MVGELLPTRVVAEALPGEEALPRLAVEEALLALAEGAPPRLAVEEAPPALAEGALPALAEEAPLRLAGEAPGILAKEAPKTLAQKIPRNRGTEHLQMGDEAPPKAATEALTLAVVAVVGTPWGKMTI